MFQENFINRQHAEFGIWPIICLGLWVKYSVDQLSCFSKYDHIIECDWVIDLKLNVPILYIKFVNVFYYLFLDIWVILGLSSLF